MRKLVLIGFIAALAGCANLQEVNDSLKKANATLSGAKTAQAGQLGDGTGYQPALNIPVPGGICNVQAFTDGYRDAFIQNWNQAVSTKVAQFNAQTLASPKDVNAKSNLAMYKARMIGTKGYLGHQMDYKLDVSSFNANNCPYQSYQKGQAAGMDAVASNWKALVAQEL